MDRRYVGIDLHRRRSVIYAMNAQGERLFYYVDREEAYRSLVAHIDQITVLGPQSYTVDSLGTLFGGVDARVLRLAKEHHVKVMPLFVNEGFNQPALRRRWMGSSPTTSPPSPARSADSRPTRSTPTS